MREQSYIKNNSHQNNIRGGETKVMKKVLNTLLILALIFTMVSPAFAAADTTQQKFDELKAAGVLAGDANGNMLALDSTMDRQMLAKIACQLTGVAATPGVEIAAFAGDYKTGVWGFDQGWVQAAYNAGLMKGKGAAGFDATGTVTVGELMTVIIRSMGLENQVDASKVWPAGEMALAVSKGLIPAAGVTASEDATYAALVTQTYNSYVYNKPAPTNTVKSVTVLNGKQIEVKFNSPIDSLTGTNGDNYYVQTNADALPVVMTTYDATAIYDLSTDKQTLVITTTAAINAQFFVNAGTPFKFIVDGVLTSAGSAVDEFSVIISSKDITAPTVTNVSASAKTTTTKVTVAFSEPVAVAGAIAYVGSYAGTVQAGLEPNEIVVTSAQALSASTTYELTLLNVADASGNFLSPNPTKQNFTVASDTVAPTVSSVVVVRDNLIEVTFDEAMDANTFAANSRILDANGVQQGGALTAVVKANTLGKTIRLSTAAAVPFAADGSFNGTLVLGTGVKDLAGNSKVASNHAVVLNKDIAGPTVVSAKYILPGAQYAGVTHLTGAVVVKFNEEVSDTATDSFVLLTAGAANVTATYLNLAAEFVSAVDASELIIPGTATPIPAGNYSLNVGTGVVKDLSNQTNSNIAGTVGLTTNNSSDITKPVITLNVAGNFVPATTQTSGTTIGGAAAGIAITDNAGLDLNTVKDINNYLLNGQPLPAGSYVTVNHIGLSTEAVPTSVCVILNIPAKSIAKEINYVLNVTNVKDKAGNVAIPQVSAAMALVDDVSPVLASASIASNGVLVLGFSEDVNAVAALGATDDDFAFTINGAAVGVADNVNIVTFADGAGTDTGKYVATFNAVVDAGADANAATTADNRLFLDVDGLGAYNAGDILVLTGTTTAVGAVAALDLNLLSGLKVTVDATATTVVDATAGIAGPIQLGTSITVK
ncbi:MAG: Ig-like domain-containing protein [Vulcanibacillus sp.]